MPPQMRAKTSQKSRPSKTQRDTEIAEAHRCQKDITTMFDRVAHRYDFLNTLLSCGMDRLWRRKLIAWVNKPLSRSARIVGRSPASFATKTSATKTSSATSREADTQKSKKRFVDVATGTGDVVIRASRSLNSYSFFHGVDLSQAMLDKAQEKAQWTAAPVTFHHCDGRDLPFADHHIDTLTISFGLRNIQGVEEALTEFHRVLKPGTGRALILEFFPPNHSTTWLSIWEHRIFNLYFRYVLPRIAGIFSKSEDYAYLPDSVAKFYTPDELSTLAQTSGLTMTRQHHFFPGPCVLIEFQKLE